jgi:Reverse transcriptase (RNA-dependent DNA polymerase)/GAG-pre-integrase domain
MTWEYLGQALALYLKGAEVWVDIARGCCMFWLIVRLNDPTDRGDSYRNESSKWKRRHKTNRYTKMCNRLSVLGSNLLSQIDRAVTWAIGDEPTHKERLTWTSPRFRCQQRVRRDRSTGQGYNKRRMGTSEWYRTAAVISLMVTSGQAKSTRFDSDSVLLHVDNCASRCITNSISDFVKAPQKVIGRVKGMGGDKVAVEAVGTIRWTFDDDDGVPHAFLIPGSLYIPSSPARLFSPQHWAQERKDNAPVKNGTWQATFADHVMLVWGQQKYRRRIPLDKSNVATFSTTAGCKMFRVFQACLESAEEEDPGSTAYTAFDATLIIDDEDDFPNESDHRGSDDDDESSIVPIQPPATNRIESHLGDDRDDPGYSATTGNHETSYDKYTATIEDVAEDEFDGKLKPTTEILLWHFRLGHIPFSRLQTMAKTGLLPKRLSDCRIPKCASCIYGKMTRRAKRSKNESTQISARTVTGPGSCVSVDQLESSTLGLIGHMKGTPTIQRYRCATVYVDHYSRLSYIHLQKQLTSEETVQGKVAFEKYCEARGVTVKHYHADNGRFADKGFVNHVTKCRQSITYCGVNAHFQNGMAEKRIRDLQDQTTTMLMHAESKWPDVITVNLWPYALREANESLNATPSKVTGSIANQLFTRSEVPTVLRHFHPFGCPTYILNDSLAAGKSIPKWHKRARLGVYLGRSPEHSQSVALVMNLATGLVSPQFHLKFDDLFETVKDHDTYPNNWKSATHFRKSNKQTKGKEAIGKEQRQSSDRIRDPEQRNDEPIIENQATPVREDNAIPAPNGVTPADTPVQGDVRAISRSVTQAAPPQTESEAMVRRWSKRHKPTQRLIESQAQANAFAVTYHSDNVCGGCSTKAAGNDYATDVYHGAEEYEIQREMADPIAFAASADPDVMYLHEAMKQPDRKEFVQAMVDEVTTHTERGHWKIIEIGKVPVGTKILPAVWAMRRKRRIMSREVYKWKARLNVHGGKQTYGVDYWETYAAALKWSSIRFFLTQALINGWHTRQLDFVLAYPQADVECDLYLEIPLGFEFEGSRKTHCLKLIKNLYGSKAAGRVWQQHLFKGLADIGFTQSGTDECVFYRGTTIFMVYTDDGIFCGPDEQEIATCMSELGTRFEITDEGDIDEYLGVKVTRMPDGTITLTQPHLIDSIISDLGFKENTKGKDTPAPSTASIDRDLNGKDHDESWEYRSVIGKLNFLEKSTRPDIAFAVHQCARYSSNPKESHSAAVRYIVRYLMTTRDKGLILKPNCHSFVCYVDADFQGGWDIKTASEDSTTAKSRTAYIVMYGGCPIVWASKMQTDIALSTTESEYSALSEATREVLWLMGLMTEVKDRIVPGTIDIPTIKCTVFEDNEGAKAMATVPKMRPRTKHINGRMHHFRSAVSEGKLLIESIDTSDQLADIGTKPLAKDLFTRLRKEIMGW